MALSDMFAGWLEDRMRGRDEWLLMADEAEERRERAIRKRDAQRAKEDLAHEREMRARDRAYAAEYKLSLVEQRRTVVADQLWEAERMADVDVGMKFDDWDERAAHLQSVEHGLGTLVERFEHDREEAEFDAKESQRTYWMAHARADELQDEINKHSEQYDRAIEAAGL